MKCDRCGSSIGRKETHYLVHGDHDHRTSSTLRTFCTGCVNLGPRKGGASELHRLVDEGCDVPWHDVWDHSFVAIPKNGFESDRLRRFMLQEDPKANTEEGARTAGDLIVLGLCSGACLVADPDSVASCDCKCGGSWHGALIDVPLNEGEDRVKPQLVNAHRPDGLVGMWFHSFKTYPDGCRLVDGQGRVLKALTSDRLLVQHHEWLMGEPDGCSIVLLEEMSGWQFYESSAEMVHQYEHRGWSSRADAHMRHDSEGGAL